MNRLLKVTSAVVLFVVAVLPATPAIAGPYTDAFGMCLVRNTSPADKPLLVKWMFATMSLHPEVESMVVISYDQRDALNEATADMFMRLVTESCVNEVKEAFRYEGASAFEGAFAVLGQVATRELFEDEAVSEGMGRFSEHLDETELKSVFSEDQPDKPEQDN